MLVTKLLKLKIWHGQKTVYRNQWLAQYIGGFSGLKYRTDFFKLYPVICYFQYIYYLIRLLSQNYSKLLFISTHKDIFLCELIVIYAKKFNIQYIVQEWQPGLLLNEDPGRLKLKYTYPKLLNKWSDRIYNYTLPLPEAIVVFTTNPSKDYTMLRELNRIGLPIIGIVDTFTDIQSLYYPFLGSMNIKANVDYICRFLLTTYFKNIEYKYGKNFF